MSNSKINQNKVIIKHSSMSLEKECLILHGAVCQAVSKGGNLKVSPKDRPGRKANCTGKCIEEM